MRHRLMNRPRTSGRSARARAPSAPDVHAPPQMSESQRAALDETRCPSRHWTRRSIGTSPDSLALDRPREPQVARRCALAWAVPGERKGRSRAAVSPDFVESPGTQEAVGALVHRDPTAYPWPAVLWRFVEQLGVPPPSLASSGPDESLGLLWALMLARFVASLEEGRAAMPGPVERPEQVRANTSARLAVPIEARPLAQRTGAPQIVADAVSELSLCAKALWRLQPDG